MEEVQSGIERTNLDTRSLKSVREAKRGVIVRLSRTGKGSISGARLNHTTKQTRVIDEAYSIVREAVSN